MSDIGDVSRVPAVSVCVPLYQKEDFIAAAIRSVLDQTFRDFELVVLDNACTDRSGEIARSFDDPRIVVRRNESTIPAVENFNKVVSLSRAPLVKALMADDVIHPTCLERQVETLRGDERLAMTVARMHMVDEFDEIIAADRGIRYADLIGRQRRPAVLRRVVRHGGNPIGVPTTVLFRRSAFDAAGGFAADEDFFSADVSMWLRLLEHGDFFGMPETLTGFRINSGSNSARLGREAIEQQRDFISALRRANPDVVRRRDWAQGAVRFPLTRLRHHVLFAAAGPRSGLLRQVAVRVMAVSPPARTARS